MSRKPDVNVPGVERKTAITGLGQLDIGRIIRVEGMRWPLGVLMQVLEVKNFKGMMPVASSYRLRLMSTSKNWRWHEKWFDTGKLPGDFEVLVGKKYKPTEDHWHLPQRTKPRPQRRPKKPAGVAWSTETPSK